MAEIRLPAIFGSNMVVQANAEIPVLGWANPGETVEVKFYGQTATARADGQGEWRLQLDPVKAGGPYRMEVMAGDENLIYENVLAGEVWLCGGQSNMAFRVENANNAEEEMAAADIPEIRLFIAGSEASETPLRELEGEWKVCSPETAGDFSAVGYFFGRELHEKLGVPVGLINSSKGGTRAEAWTEWSYLQDEPAYEEFMEPYLEFFEGTPEEMVLKRMYWETWRKMKNDYTDPGNYAYFLGWAEPDFDDSGWGVMEQPGFWEKKGLEIDGVVWFRKRVSIPEEWAGDDLLLSLGKLDEYDETYFNGWKVGETGEEVENPITVPREYLVPKKYVRAGEENVITVRIFDESARGGFRSIESYLTLAPAGKEGVEPLPLAGPWRYAVEYGFKEVRSGAFPRLPSNGVGPNYRHAPSNLYNGMIAPLVPYALSGVVWYQGESNAGRAEQYQKLFPALIRSWRNAWGQVKLPFYLVQLANFHARQTEPVEDGWAFIREAQGMALELPDTGMALAIDVGEADDIHPTDKQTVGHRLALIARAQLYGEDIPYSGPDYRAMAVAGREVQLIFEHTDGGLKTADGEPLKGFAITGDGETWHWAKAKIEGDTVVVWNEEVSTPQAVRYAWADNPIGNLYNGAGLPAVPFRTDR